MSDPTSYGHYDQRAAGIRPDHICWIWFGSRADAFFLHWKWPGASLLDLNQICFCTAGLIPISIHYPGSTWTEWIFMKPDPTPLWQNRLGSHPAFLFRAGGRSIFCTSSSVPVLMCNPGSTWLNKARSDLIPAKQIGNTTGISLQGQMVIAKSESDLIWFLYIGPSWFQYWCVIQDPFGLNETRSDLPQAKQIGITSGISIQGPMLMAQSESDPLLYIWHGSDISALSRLDLFGLNKARSDPLPAKQIGTISGISVQGRVLMAISELNRSIFVHPARFQYQCIIQDPFGLNKASSDPLPEKDRFFMLLNVHGGGMTY